jgi:hypothetical protein
MKIVAAFPEGAIIALFFQNSMKSRARAIPPSLERVCSEFVTRPKDPVWLQ